MNWFSWDNLNRKPSIFPWNSWGFPVNCPLNQSIEHSGGIHKKHCFKGGSDREQKSTLNEWSLRNHWQFKSSQLSIQCRRLLNLLSLKPRDRGQLVFFWHHPVNKSQFPNSSDIGKPIAWPLVATSVPVMEYSNTPTPQWKGSSFPISNRDVGWRVVKKCVSARTCWSSFQSSELHLHRILPTLTPVTVFFL